MISPLEATVVLCEAQNRTCKSIALSWYYLSWSLSFHLLHSLLLTIHWKTICKFNTVIISTTGVHSAKRPRMKRFGLQSPRCCKHKVNDRYTTQSKLMQFFDGWADFRKSCYLWPLTRRFVFISIGRHRRVVLRRRRTSWRPWFPQRQRAWQAHQGA